MYPHREDDEWTNIHDTTARFRNMIEIPHSSVCPSRQPNAYNACQSKLMHLVLYIITTTVFCFLFALLLTNIDSLTTQSRSMSNWSPAIIRLFAEQVLICNKEKNHCDASITLHSLCVCPARAFHSHKQLWFLSAVHAIDIRQSDFHSASVRNKRRKEKTNLLNRNDTNSVESMLPNQNWKLLQMEMDTPHSYIYNTMLKTELLSVSDLLTRSHYVILWLIFSVLLIE